MSKLLLLLTLTFVGIRGSIQIARGSEALTNGDEARQIMTAVFWLDFMHVGPRSDPTGFAHAYYGHYPAIAPLHWPPLTHFLAGVLFLMTGPSVAAAQSMILVMAIGVVVGLHRLARRWMGRFEATLACVLLATASGIQEFTAVFMLEVPCLLWMVLSVVTLGAYVQTRGTRWIWLCSICVVAGALTEQQAIAIMPVIVDGGVKMSHLAEQKCTA